VGLSKQRPISLLCQNKQNRLYTKAVPLDEVVIKYIIEDGNINALNEPKIRAQVLADEYGWYVTKAKKIWCFGPDTTGPNLHVDVTKGVQYLTGIRDSSVAGFQWATEQGVFCEENMRGIRFNILDATVWTAFASWSVDIFLPLEIL
jgi:elongation factor 2